MEWIFQATYLWDAASRTWYRTQATGPQLGSGWLSESYTTAPAPPYAQTHVWRYGPQGWQLADTRRNY